jgi:hypothetical protein
MQIHTEQIQKESTMTNLSGSFAELISIPPTHSTTNVRRITLERRQSAAKCALVAFAWDDGANGQVD